MKIKDPESINRKNEYKNNKRFLKDKLWGYLSSSLFGIKIFKKYPLNIFVSKDKFH